MNDLVYLQLMRMKGLTTPSAIAESLGETEEQASARCKQFEDLGLVSTLAERIRLTPSGRHHLSGLLLHERAAIDGDAIQMVYEQFCSINSDLKEAVAGWQICPDGSCNQHQDSDYDFAIVERIKAVHVAYTGIAQSLEEQCPRLNNYRMRLSKALLHVASGDADYVSRPIIDSYHTVWFELHEDLIAISGRSRSEEAAAGRAA